MSWEHPEFLLLLLPAAALFWRLPPGDRRQRWWRGAVWLLLILALTQPGRPLADRPGRLFVLADRSASLPPEAAERQLEVVSQLEASRPPDAPGVELIAFAAGNTVEKLPEEPAPTRFRQPLPSDRSELARALETVLQSLPGDVPGRILILSDGLWTGTHPYARFAEAAARGIPIDYRLLRRTTTGDWAFTDVTHPWEAAPGEEYALQLELTAPEAGDAELVVYRGTELWRRGRVALRRGTNRLEFRDRAATPGVLSYRVQLLPPGTDPIPENNQLVFPIRIRGRRPVLLCTRNPDSGLARLLRQAQVPVEVRGHDGEVDFSLGVLSGYAAVILENFPAARIGQTGMRNLAALVNSGSLGLLLTGGRNSFGLGGYYRSPLEPVLPVTMELRNEHRKSNVALAIALDRSGSMSQPVGGNRTKMDMANLATAEAIAMLGPRDQAAVIAVDSSAHRILPLMPAPEAQAQEDRVLAIAARGGGIFIYNALEAAVRELLSATAATRHLLLFADASDSEQPGAYRELLAHCRKNGITLSVIGLGSEHDSDAELLADLARRGGGQLYFSNTPDELPQLFLQETITITRTGFIEAKTGVELNAAARVLRPEGFQPTTFELDGYNPTFARPEATVAATTADEEPSPVIAFMASGNGRSGVFTGELTASFAQYPEHGALLLALLQYLTPQDQELPPGCLVEPRLERGIFQLRLYLDPERERDPFDRTPELLTLEPDALGTPQLHRRPLTYLDPDTLYLELPLTGTAPVATALDFGGPAPCPLPPVQLPDAPEFRPLPPAQNGDTLPELAALTGGRERLELSGIWHDLGRERRTQKLTPLLLTAALLLFLLGIADRRLDWLRRRRRFRGPGDPAAAPTSRHRLRLRRRSRQEPPPASAPAPTAAPEVPPEPASSSEPETELLSALKTVKKWKK